MPGRPAKNRRKEMREIEKAEKLTKRVLAITCSIFKSSKHNMRSCPLIPRATTHEAPAAPSRKKYLEPPAGSPKRKRKIVPAAGSLKKKMKTVPAVGTSKEKMKTVPAAGTSKEKMKTDPAAGTSKAKAGSKFNASQQSSIASALVDTQASTSVRQGVGGNRKNAKRPKIIGQGVFVSQFDYSCINETRNA